jgi:hypothetical protein
MKYLVIPKEESLITVDYVIESDEYTHSLYYSGSDIWEFKLRGKLIGTIYDDGNGVLVSDCWTKRYLNYSELSELNVLLTFINKVDHGSYRFSILKQQEI